MPGSSCPSKSRPDLLVVASVERGDVLLTTRQEGAVNAPIVVDSVNLEGFPARTLDRRRPQARPARVLVRRRDRAAHETAEEDQACTQSCRSR